MGVVDRDDPVRVAEKQQGGERYCGVDGYRTARLEPGTRLVKLEPPRPKYSTSGYFMLWEEYRKLNTQAQLISEGVQVAPYVKTTNSQRSYSYYPEVSIWKVEKPIQVALGKTEANRQYGQGGLTQVYIPGFRGGDPEHNRALGLLEGQRESLQNNQLENKYGDQIQKRLFYHQRVRNQFCHLDQLNELRKLKSELSDPLVLAKINKFASDIAEKSARYQERIQGTHAELRVPCPAYDDKIAVLKKTMAGNETLSVAQNRDIARLRDNLMAKVSDSIGQVVCGELSYGQRNHEIQVDQLRAAYECRQFVARVRCLDRLRDNDQRVRAVERELGRFERREPASLPMPAERSSLEKELGGLYEEGRALRTELGQLERQAAQYRRFVEMGAADLSPSSRLGFGT